MQAYYAFRFFNVPLNFRTRFIYLSGNHLSIRLSGKCGHLLITEAVAPQRQFSAELFFAGRRIDFHRHSQVPGSNAI